MLKKLKVKISQIDMQMWCFMANLSLQNVAAASTKAGFDLIHTHTYTHSTLVHTGFFFVKFALFCSNLYMSAISN